MNLGISGKVALVTGASRGIGREIAISLANEGCRVAINGRDKLALEEVGRNCGFDFFIADGDVSTPEGAQHVAISTFNGLGPVDILVANVGSGSSVAPGLENYEEWQTVFSKNFFSTTNIVESTKKIFNKNGGSIVCISSICGLGVINGAPITYSVAKAALNSYIKMASRPLSKDLIRINGLAPGNVIFEESSWANKIAKNSSEVKRMLECDVPMGRFSTPDEIAGIVLFLASPLSGYTTGSIWVSDGGQLR